MLPDQHHVVILGASPKPARYANQAQRLLANEGYRITPVHPKLRQIDGLEVTNRLATINQPVHTLTLYIGPQRLEPVVEELLALRPQRVIFNPGTESTLIQQRLDQADIAWLEGCTLVMLRTGVFLEDCEP
jgi:predicted CoA-binding protein